MGFWMRTGHICSGVMRTFVVTTKIISPQAQLLNPKPRQAASQ